MRVEKILEVLDMNVAVAPRLNERGEMVLTVGTLIRVTMTIPQALLLAEDIRVAAAPPVADD